MKKLLFVLISISIFSFLGKAQPQDSIFVIISGDTVQIWNTGAWENCGSLFRMDLSISNDTIYVTEVDTTDMLAYCTCYFDLRASVTGLSRGYYWVEVYRRLLLLYPDTIFFIGSTSFNYGGSQATFTLNSYQSDCKAITSISKTEEAPDEFKLNQNYPNPFNPDTKISWQSPVGSWQSLKVFDVLGREVNTLVDEFKDAGNYEVEFNGNDLSSGIYFYQLKSGSFIQTKKMILLR